MAHICALGYSRAHLYELSEDGSMLKGREQQGDTKIPIKEVVLPIAQDEYSRRTLESKVPLKYSKGQHGQTLFDDILDREEIEEWIDIPLFIDNKDVDNVTYVGKITIDNKVIRPTPPGFKKKKPEPINEQHYEQFMQFARFAAMEIINERENKSIQAESKRLRMLRTLSEKVAGESNIKEDLQTIVESSAELTGAIGVHLRLLEEDGYILTSGLGDYYEMAQQIRPVVLLSDIESGSVIAGKQKNPYIQPDAERDPNFVRFKESIAGADVQAKLNKIKSFSSFQILFEDKVMGVLNLQSDQPGFFGQSVCEAIEDFAADDRTNNPY